MELVPQVGAREGRDTASGAERLAAAMAQAGKSLGDVTMLAAQGYAARQVASQALAGLAAIPVLDWVQKIGQAVAEEVLQTAVYNSHAAVVPAQQTLAALETTERQAVGLIARIRRDSRRRPWHLFVPRRYWQVEPAQLGTELQRLANRMWLELNQCQFAGDRVLQKCHPLGRIVAVNYVGEQPRLEGEQVLFPVARKVYCSDRDKVKDLRWRVERLAIHLRRYTRDARAILEAERSEGGGAFPPEVEWSEAATFVSKAIGVMATCSALQALANQKVAPKQKHCDHGKQSKAQVSPD